MCPPGGKVQRSFLILKRGLCVCLGPELESPSSSRLSIFSLRMSSICEHEHFKECRFPSHLAGQCDFIVCDPFLLYCLLCITGRVTSLVQALDQVKDMEMTLVVMRTEVRCKVFSAMAGI